MAKTRPIVETPPTSKEREGHKVAIERDFNPKPHPNPGKKNTTGSVGAAAGRKISGGGRISGGTT